MSDDDNHSNVPLEFTLRLPPIDGSSHQVHLFSNRPLPYPRTDQVSRPKRRLKMTGHALILETDGRLDVNRRGGRENFIILWWLLQYGCDLINTQVVDEIYVYGEKHLAADLWEGFPLSEQYHLLDEMAEALGRQLNQLFGAAVFLEHRSAPLFAAPSKENEDG